MHSVIISWCIMVYIVPVIFFGSFLYMTVTFIDDIQKHEINIENAKFASILLV